MSNSNEINAQHAIDTLQFFRESISHLAQIDGLSDPKITSMNIGYSAFIQTHQEIIAENMQSEVGFYLTFYKVTPDNDIFDEFKNIYFLGMAITKELESKGHIDLAKYQLRAILHLLDLRLASEKAVRPLLTQRIKDAIENSAVKKDFGRFGWYILYKCLYNAAIERR